MEQPVSVGYYDRVLIAIGLSLTGGALAGLTTPIRLRLGLTVGALVATVFVYEALFRNPPLPERTGRETAAAVLWHVFLAYLLLTTV